MTEKITKATKIDLNNENFLRVAKVERKIKVIQKTIAATLPQNQKGLLLDIYM
jgi:hypothetical protein